MRFTVTSPLNGNTIVVTALAEKTRSGFRHLASGGGTDAKCTYLNRTWEAYTFQSVLHEWAYRYLVKMTGMNPKTKRDGEKFNALWRTMNAEFDKQGGTSW